MHLLDREWMLDSPAGETVPSKWNGKETRQLEKNEYGNNGYDGREYNGGKVKWSW